MKTIRQTSWKTRTVGLLGVSGLFLLSACATTATSAEAQVPREIVDANAAYNHARSSPAAIAARADLWAAHDVLVRAQQAYEADPGSQVARDLGYLAQRRSQLAEARADTLVAARQLAMHEAELRRLRSQGVDLGQYEHAHQQLQRDREQIDEAANRARDAFARLSQVPACSVTVEKRGTVITIPGSVLFAFGQAELLTPAREKLNQVAEALRDQAQNMVVEGYTDSIGTPDANLDLSQRRADAVREYLVSRGIPGGRIRSRGLGETRPVADNASPEGRANNRRVEIVVETPASSSSSTN